MQVALPILNHRFAPPPLFRASSECGYTLLPFRFIRLDEERYVLSNFAGQYHVLSRELLNSFVRHELGVGSEAYDALQTKHFLMPAESNVALDLLAVQYRTKQFALAQLTGLFLFVVTLRCDHSCPYCQVSRQSSDRHAFDMREDAALAAVHFVSESPSTAIKVEFQGGEPLLNFELIKKVVTSIERMIANDRTVQFVIATNLSCLTDEMLSFCGEHDVYFSTSLDGPSDLHNRNRPRPGGDSYELTIEGIRRVREALGPSRIAALMTTTEASLPRARDVVDEYVQQRFSSIFLRNVSPFGFAVRSGLSRRYTIDRWIKFYQEALEYIIELNQHGVAIREEYSAMLLRKILTPYSSGYVDLQSPAGLGIGAVAFNYDGGIYASDEARMLAATGDSSFRLGELGKHSFSDVMSSERLLDVLQQTMTEGMPMCADCGFQPYCGSDPIYHYVTQRDVVGSKPHSDFCRKNMEVMRHLIRLLEDDLEASKVLRSWI